MKLVECGLYTIKDKYFSDFKSDRHMHNKSEGRPYYLSIQMKNGIVWFIPLSSKVEKYKAKIAQDESKFLSHYGFHGWRACSAHRKYDTSHTRIYQTRVYDNESAICSS